MARVLALTARLPYPPREGHQLRSWHLLRALAAAHEVTLLSCLRDDDAPEQCGPLRDIVADLETFPIRVQQSPAALAAAAAKSLFARTPFVVAKYAAAPMRARVAARMGATDLIHVDMLPLMALVGDGERPPLVLNAHNVEHALLRQRAASEPRLPLRAFLRSQTAMLEAFERDSCRRADRVIACSADDARMLSALAPRTPVAIVPNGVDVEAKRPCTTPARAAQLVFVGSMGWFPNREGVQWFLAEIFPRILAARPDAEFVIVGKPEGLRVPIALQGHVRLAGFVDDVAASVCEAEVCVVPLRSGSGTRLKVLEAMAHAKPIVTTTIGAQGIDLAPETEALFADDADAFAASVLRLLAAPQAAVALGAAARARAKAQYDWNAIGAQALDVYSELLDAARPAARQR